MEKSAYEDHPFPVQIAYSAYRDLTVCTVTVGSTRSDDDVAVTTRSDDRPVPTGQQARDETLPDNRDEAVSRLLDEFNALWARYWASSRPADYHPASSSHVLTTYLVGDTLSLSIALTREGQTIAHSIVIYHSGGFRIVESTGLSISFESGAPDPVLAATFGLLISWLTEEWRS